MFDEWTPETIAERQGKLAVWAMKRWSVAPADTATVEAEDADPDMEADGAEDEADTADSDA